MKILAFNCGSSTLKFQLAEITEENGVFGKERRLALGTVDRIGRQGTVRCLILPGKEFSQPVTMAGHGEAVRWVLGWLDENILSGRNGLTAAGHRVVHGGDLFVNPTLINDDVVRGIESLSHLAPLHNEPALSAIRATREILGSAVPQVAVFDTAFHRTLPGAAGYALPADLVDKHKIRRYGFHGLAHRYMTERYAAITGTPPEQTKLITLQLGNGCSAAAIEYGRSVDTSMGFTPLEGLVMGTRSGDIDPTLAGYIAKREKVEVQEVERWLNARSGLLGVSGLSSDMRELLEAEDREDKRAALAVDMFCYRVRKFIGAYLAVLGGADAVIFGGGIGENSPRVRARICQAMDWCGLEIDPGRNAAAIGIEGRISAGSSRIEAWVIPVYEETVIAHDTAACLYSR
ncbi:MAG TPA: acetate kinase [Candidatus Limnocylindrales bacterium]|nr:acetate kinase [Candidatus Limnocylindrales bacterium]